MGGSGLDLVHREEAGLGLESGQFIRGHQNGAEGVCMHVLCICIHTFTHTKSGQR